MSNRIGPHGTALLGTVAASDIITAYSRDDAKVYSRAVDGVNWALLGIIAANLEYSSAALSAASEIKIEAGGEEVLYNWGVAPKVLDRRGLRGQGAPGVLNSTGALTAAMILSGLVTSTTGSAVTATLPTGTVLDAAQEMGIGESFDWSVIVTGGNAFTVTAASGHTVVGVMVVPTVSSASFRTRKTAAATYITYSLAIAAS
jgi:hypothetical protein